MMPLAEYWDLLDTHDWYYPFSDAGLTYKLGEASEKQLIEIAKQSAEHLKLFEGFQKHFYSGKPFDTEQQAKPKRP